MNVRKRYWGLLRHRQCLLPTARGCLLLLVVISLTIAFALGNIHSWLAVHEPIPGSVLVVEGWGPDYMLEEARTEFNQHLYERLLVTGGPFLQGMPFSEFKTQAELSAAILVRLGMNSNVVHAVPSPAARQDRTYASALALKRWFLLNGGVPSQINLISLGVHARRTRLLFERALGKGTQVGIMAVESRDYDPRRWWRTSQGFRVVTDEVVAYLYARFIFSPPPE
ncbi:MAG: YdcF family protein [Verrucomicrobia bacterium]|nr:YdcF family protein [Verrucomicrobiota bacterium]